MGDSLGAVRVAPGLDGRAGSVGEVVGIGSASGSAPPVEVVRSAVATNVRRARLASGRSMRELAESTGLSSALLSQIERRVANPTIAALARIAAALDVTVAELARVDQPVPEVAGRLEHDAAPVLRTLHQMVERRRAEITEALFPASHSGTVGTHEGGSIEFAYVVEGAVRLVVDGVEHHLRAGESVRFSASAGHAYSTGDMPARVLTVLIHDE